MILLNEVYEQVEALQKLMICAFPRYGSFLRYGSFPRYGSFLRYGSFPRYGSFQRGFFCLEHNLANEEWFD